MELLMATAALIALDILARFFGYDSRDDYDRAIDAAHRGDGRLSANTSVRWSVTSRDAPGSSAARS